MFASSTPALDHTDFIQKSHIRKDKRLDISWILAQNHIQICQVFLKTLCQAEVTFKVDKMLKI